LFVAAALIIGVAIADYATGYAVRLSILYLLPIAMATWTAGAVMGMAAAVVSSSFWLFSFKSEHFYLHQGFYFWEAAVMLLGFLAFAWSLARLRRALSQADERFSRVIEEMHAAVYVADEARDEIVYANSEMKRIAGDLANKNPGEFERQFRHESDSSVTGTFRPIEQGFTSGTVLNPQTGRWYLLQSGPIPWGSNPHVKLKVLTDVTEQKNAELLREKHRGIIYRATQLTTLAEIASTLAHEINQPLMVIATYTDACQRLLDTQDFDRQEISRALRKCHDQAVRVSSIIERLREFIRQRQPQPSQCDVKSVVSEAVAMLRPQLDEACITVDVSQVIPTLVIFADKILLIQVLVNLMRNAIDAMRDNLPQARKLSISVALQESGNVEFSVSDNGSGLGEASLEELSSPFFTTKPDGLGLGLAICRSVAEAHGGRLWATENPLGGTIFHLSIPAGLSAQ
jgi:C4-dicarboxylate-specific signal transduction histidine kinase